MKKTYRKLDRNYLKKMLKSMFFWNFFFFHFAGPFSDDAPFEFFFKNMDFSHWSNQYRFLTMGWGTKAQFFCPPYLKTWFFYLVFNAELNWTIRILCFCRAILDLPRTIRAQLGHSRSIMVWLKHKILMVPFNSALITT